MASGGAQPIRVRVEGAPFQPGDRVRVVGAIDVSVHDVRMHIGAVGVVDYLEYECGCGQRYPEMPMIGVRMGSVREEFWPEELTLARDDEEASIRTRVVDLGGYDLAEYDGMCLELVNDLLHVHPDGQILYVEPPGGHRWRYHAVLVLEGLTYDAWHPDVRLPPAEYVERVFGPHARWEINPGSHDEEDDERCTT